ncbi:MAG: hypothetical protein KC434_20050, partial [Anaerolineales bacterium]|nr:hypothetical protein [Anaerolineales bacterium]
MDVYKQIVDVLTIIVISVGGGGILLLGVASLISKIWSEVISIRTKARHDQKLEELRAEISERQDFLNASLSSLSTGYQESHKEIILALQTLWETVLEIRQFVSPFIFPYTVLVRNEYSGIPVHEIGNGYIADGMPRISEEQFFKALPVKDSEIEKRRLFVGEKLWLMFQIYNALSSRLAYKVVKVLNEKNQIPEWDKDFEGRPDPFFNSLSVILEENEIKQIIDIFEINTPQLLLSAVEEKILGEMNELIFG